MDTKRIIGAEIIHAKCGEGIVKAVGENYIKVEFGSDDEKEFQFPMAFQRILRFKDDSLQKAIEEEINNKEHITKASSRNLTITKTAKTYQNEKLQRGDGFSTHAEALNECFGYDYKVYQQAYKVINDDYAVWFPNIAQKRNGEYVSTDKTLGWVNVLADKGTVIVQRDRDKKQTHDNEKFVKKRLVFAKKEGDSRYVFIGLFDEGVRVEDGIKFTRISESFDLIKMQPI